MAAVEDYYAVLGIDRTASPDEVKKAYRRLTLEFHPDRHPHEPGAQDRFRSINQAYAILGDAQARSRYDASLRLHEGLDLARGFDVQTARDLLGNVIGDVFGARRRERRGGRDLRYTLSVDLEEAVLGSSHEIHFEAPGPCSVCKGTGARPGGREPHPCPVCAGRGEVKGEGLFARRTRCGRCDGTGMVQLDACETCRGSGTRRQERTFVVRLPPGTEAGAEKVIEGQGEPGRFGGKPGDLRVTVNVRPHPWLTRQGDEMRYELSISLTEATYGAAVPVPTVDGVVLMDIPAGIRSGTRMRLRGKGVPLPAARRKRGLVRGDQIVTIVIETPARDALPEVDELLRRLEDASASPKVLPRRHAQRSALTRRSDAEADS
jgi:molecular chaperone DnaJ